MKRIFLGIALLLGLCATGICQLRLPHVWSDNMVLQRNATTNIWGWGYATQEVVITASWLEDTVKTIVDADGRWAAQLPTGEAGGPYELKVASTGTEITLGNLLLGEVWLCSGQSNMEWGGNQRLPEIMDELPRASDGQIRLFQVSRQGADYPQADVPNSWQLLDAESLKPFSAIGYFIAKKFREELDVPIGIINASWGGTPAEVWTPGYLVANDPVLHAAAIQQDPAPYRPHRSGVLWNSMIYPLSKFTISGFFWYQGESNVGTWRSYDKLMRTMITSWRMAWNADLPFYFVQIAPFDYGNELPLAALLREQQTRTAASLPNTGMVVVTDLVDDVKNIHPVQKREVANRLATIALNDHYRVRNDADYISPRYRSHEVNGNTVVVSFDFVDGGLKTEGGPVTELFIAGADRVFYQAQAVVEGNTLVVSAPEVANPVAVRFGFTETAMPNLFNSNGLPVTPFRTDGWAF